MEQPAVVGVAPVGSKDSHDVKRTTKVRFDVAKYEERKARGTTEFTLEDGTVVRQFEVGKGQERNFLEYLIPPRPKLFQQVRRYYVDGSLKLEGTKLHSGLQVGVWKSYDSSGKLSQETDHEIDYGFTFEQLLKVVATFHRDNNYAEVDLLDKMTSVGRSNTEEGKHWFFSWQAIPGRVELLKYDGDTGDLLEQSHYEHAED